MKRRTDARTRQGQGDGHSPTGVSRRDVLKGLAAIAAAAMCPDQTGRPSETMAAEKLFGSILDLAEALAEWEREAIEDEFPKLWKRILYIQTIRWKGAIYAAVGVAPRGYGATMLTAAKSLAGRNHYRCLAEGWSPDKRVWCLFFKDCDDARAESEAGRKTDLVLAKLMSTIAPDAEAWKDQEPAVVREPRSRP